VLPLFNMPHQSPKSMCCRRRSTLGVTSGPHLPACLPACLQPLDALGTVLEGGILGASDTGYLGARTAASCAVSLLVLGAASATHGTLLSVWLGMKCVNVCALALDLAKFRSRSSPRSPPSKHSE
jgi:hypothetical protein